MELKDTIKWINSDDYKKRFLAEYWQAVIRKEQLCKTLDKQPRGEFDIIRADYELLHEQLVHLEGYIATLEEQAERHGIRLMSPKQYKIFLGGTCNGSTWRADLMKLITDDKRYETYKDLFEIFNPEVEDWDEDARVKEMQFKEDCDLQIYVITPRINGVYSIAEIMASIYDKEKYPYNETLVSFINEDTNFKGSILYSLHAFSNDFIPERMIRRGLPELKDEIYKKIEDFSYSKWRNAL